MWVKKRHKVVVSIIKPFFRIFSKLRYRCTFDKAKSFPSGAVVLANHVTTMDPFMMGMLIKEQVYYMASKDLLAHRFTGRLIEYLVHIIPKEKSKSNDFAAIRYCLRVAKENGVIGIFPEGNRTFSGDLGYISPSIIKLCKSIKKPIVILNIQGGYPTDPRWGRSIRKGRMHVGFKHIYNYEDYKDIDNDTLYNMIVNDLNVDDYNTNVRYKGRNMAEYLERILYICPICHKRNNIYTDKGFIKCSCGLSVEYLSDLTFKANNADFKFKHVRDWYNYQLDTIKNDVFLDNEVIYRDKVGVYMPKPYSKKVKLGEGELMLYNDKFLFKLDSQTIILEFDKILGVTLLGKKKMNIYVGNDTYQIFNDERTNLLKYMNTYYLIKNRRDGVEDGFWGL